METSSGDYRYLIIVAKSYYELDSLNSLYWVMIFIHEYVMGLSLNMNHNYTYSNCHVKYNYYINNSESKKKITKGITLQNVVMDGKLNDMII